MEKFLNMLGPIGKVIAAAGVLVGAAIGTAVLMWKIFGGGGGNKNKNNNGYHQPQFQPPHMQQPQQMGYGYAPNVMNHGQYVYGI